MDDDNAAAAALEPALNQAIDQAFRRRLLVFLGKGGVGKSTLAAATARLLSGRGKKVLLCEASGSGRLAALLGGSIGPRDAEQLQRVGPNLMLCDIEPRAALREYAVMKLKLARMVDKLLDSALVQHFLRMLPSLSETVTLGKLLFHVREEQRGRPRFDAVVFDAPATGHALSLLELPQVLMRTVAKGPLRDDMEWMNGLLVDPAVTSLVQCTLPEELPVNETLELNAALRDRLKLPRHVCLVNAVWPHRFDPPELAELRAALSPELYAVAARFEGRAALGRAQLTRLRAELGLPVIEVPRVFEGQEQSGDGLLERIAAELSRWLPASEGRRVS